MWQPNPANERPDAKSTPSMRPPILVSRRGVLQQAGLLAGSVGAAAFLAGCAQGGPAGWTFGPAASLAQAGATPGPTATLAASQGPIAAMTSASPSDLASTMPSPSGSVTARDPSPADFAVPAPYRAALSTPVEFNLTSHDGPSQTILIARSPDKPYGSISFDGQVRTSPVARSKRERWSAHVIHPAVRKPLSSSKYSWLQMPW